MQILLILYLVIYNLRFADDIDLLEEEEERLKEVTKRLDEASKRLGM